MKKRLIMRMMNPAAALVAAGLLVMPLSCYNDNFNNALKLAVVPVEVLIPGDDRPVPGGNGVIAVDSSTGTSIQISWDRATDRETNTGDLEYRAFISGENNIGTPELADENGTALTGWVADMTTAVASGLGPGTAYYFVVVVRDTAQNETAYVSISASTKNVPIPGNGGIITTGTITSTSIQVSWERATDVETAQADLEYCLYLSDQNNIGTPADAALNGKVVAGWQKNMATGVATGLAAGTTYYFNVVVRDGDGNAVAYMTVAATSESDAIYLFSAGQQQGNLTTPTTASARADVDSFCIQAKANSYPALPCMNVRTFISVSANDSIAAMPGNYGIPADKNIISPSGIVIAGTWLDLLDGSINVSLHKAGVSNNFWWSGSDSAGNYLAAGNCATCNNCSGWTDNSNTMRGRDGDTNKTDGTWLSEGDSTCSSTLTVLCACW